MPQAAPAHACVTQSAQMCGEGIHTCPRRTACAILLHVSKASFSAHRAFIV